MSKKTDLDDTKDYTNEDIFEQTKDYTEEYKILEEESKENEELKHHTHHNHKKKKVLIIITIFLLILCTICIVFLLLKDKKKNNNENDTNENKVTIQRPSKKEEYIVLKQNYITMSCRKTASGDKIKKLSKGMTIDCIFQYEVKDSQKITELYFDLNNSSSVKLKNIKNDGDSILINDESTYKLTLDTPQNIFSDLHFYFDVINDDKTGFVELNNIVFKDSNNLYYKVINSIETFPPEYDDKIYIYETKYEDSDEVFYYSSKVLDKEQKLFDTFQCQNDTCETLSESSHYFLINDEKFLIYDTIKKTTVTIDTPNTIKKEDYSYELMHNSKGNIYGVAFKKNYTSSYSCNNVDNTCINKGLSGYEIGYYSLNEKRFTIDPELKIIGSSAYQDYDYALMLKKADTYGVYSYEDDKMVIEFTNKYKSMDFDNSTSSIKMEVYDKNKDEYYFEYYDPINNSYTLNTSNLIKFKDSSIYYLEDYNQKANKVTMLFDKNGSPIKKLPYVLSKNLVVVNTKIVIDTIEGYISYDLNGNYLYKTGYYDSFILGYTKNYIIAKSELNKVEILSNDGKLILELDELNDKVSYVSSKEYDDILLVIIKDTNITEEGKNSKQYKIQNNKLVDTEYIYVE